MNCIYAGKVTIDEAGEDQSNQSENMIEIDNKSRQKKQRR